MDPLVVAGLRRRRPALAQGGDGAVERAARGDAAARVAAGLASRGAFSAARGAAFGRGGGGRDLLRIHWPRRGARRGGRGGAGERARALGGDVRALARARLAGDG